MTSLDLITILPEAALALYAIVALLLGAYLGKDRLARAMLWLSVLAMLVAAFAVGWMDRPDHTAFFGMFIDDAFARFSKVVILVSAAAVLAMSVDYLDRTRLLRFELPILVILAVIGMMVMVSAGDLLTLYMGLELQSLALYVVAALRRDSTRSSEAGLKYFVLGSLSSGMLLYGASLIYGFAGTTNLAGVMAVVGQGALPVGLLFGLVFLLVGLAFKISAVPFHMWTPDVYEGSPTPVTAFFATAPKVAAMALIARLMWGAFGHVPGDWTQIVAAMALMSMFLGSIAGIGQRRAIAPGYDCQPLTGTGGAGQPARFARAGLQRIDPRWRHLGAECCGSDGSASPGAGRGALGARSFQSCRRANSRAGCVRAFAG